MINGLEAEFVRDGALGIEGRIRTGERARMHGVFNKVLSEDRKLPIVRLNDPHDERLAGLMITQLVLEDGWIGLAIGPGYAEPHRRAHADAALAACSFAQLSRHARNARQFLRVAVDRPDGQLAEAAAAVEMVPELRGDDAGEAHVEGEAAERFAACAALQFAPLVRLAAASK